MGCCGNASGIKLKHPMDFLTRLTTNGSSLRWHRSGGPRTNTPLSPSWSGRRRSRRSFWSLKRWNHALDNTITMALWAGGIGAPCVQCWSKPGSSRSSWPPRWSCCCCFLFCMNHKIQWRAGKNQQPKTRLASGWLGRSGMETGRIGSWRPWSS